MSNKFNLNTITKLIVIVSLVLISFSFFYYFVIFLPSKERVKLEMIRNNKEDLEQCLAEAKAKLKDDNMFILEYKDKDGHRISPELFDIKFKENKEEYEEACDQCFRKFPQP